MKRIILSALLVPLLISSCHKVDADSAASADNRQAVVFTATMEAIADDAAAVDTKTSMGNGGRVLWKQGDQVSMFSGSTINERYQVSDDSDGKTSATLYRVTSPGFVAGGELPVNVAFYPYAASAGIARKGQGAYVISDLSLPATQNCALESFGNGAFPMVAVTSSALDNELLFKNVIGGLKLLLKGNAAITSISVTGNNNEKLCGAAEITVSNTDLPSIKLTDAAASTVTLDCGDGVQLEEETATAFIIALPPVTMTKGFTVTVTDSQDNQTEIKTNKAQTITRSNLLRMPAVTIEGAAADEHQYVDLGLTSGLKWATCNIGADAPEEYGDYFAWAETEPYYSSLAPLAWKDGKTGYSWGTYTWCEGSYNTQTKYCVSNSFGIVDNKTVLEAEDDAAYANWGSSWRMPTDDEWTELMTECDWTWTTLNGVNGRLVTGPNHNSIFLPAAGSWFETDLEDTGAVGLYWSSSLGTTSDYGWCTSLDSYSLFHTSYCRFFGQSIRPVKD